MLLSRLSTGRPLPSVTRIVGRALCSNPGLSFDTENARKSADTGTGEKQTPKSGAQNQNVRVARGLNRVELMGFVNRVDTQVTKDEFGAKPFVVMNVAVPGDSYRDPATGNNMQAATQWIPCISFRPTHVQMAEHGDLRDGQRVLILDGKLQTYNKQKPDGTWDNRFSVRFDRLHVMSGQNESQETGN